MKKLIMTALVLVLILALALPALAANGNNGNNDSSNGNGNGKAANSVANQTIYLKGSGKDFKEQWTNVFYLSDAKNAENPNIWHLVYSGKAIQSVTSMQITFTNGQAFIWEPGMGFSVNGGGNNYGWVLVAPHDWIIAYVDKGNNNASGSFLRLHVIADDRVCRPCNANFSPGDLLR